MPSLSIFPLGWSSSLGDDDHLLHDSMAEEAKEILGSRRREERDFGRQREEEREGRTPAGNGGT